MSLESIDNPSKSNGLTNLWIFLIIFLFCKKTFSFFYSFLIFNLSFFTILLSEIRNTLFLYICCSSWPLPAIRIISLGSAFKIAVLCFSSVSDVKTIFIFYIFNNFFLIYSGFSFLGLSSVIYIFLQFLLAIFVLRSFAEISISSTSKYYRNIFSMLFFNYLYYF